MRLHTLLQFKAPQKLHFSFSLLEKKNLDRKLNFFYHISCAENNKFNVNLFQIKLDGLGLTYLEREEKEKKSLEKLFLKFKQKNLKFRLKMAIFA